MKDENCIFCKIANGDIPSYQLYEDRDFKVIFDLSPATRGHALIIPKEHSADIFEIEDEIAAKVLIIAKKLAKVMKDVFHCDGFNILQNNGKVAGQTVFHFHTHLIPRYNDGKDVIFWTPQDIKAEQLEEMSNLIREKL